MAKNMQILRIGNDAIMNYPKAEMAVREATNEDPWGPTGPQMKKISEYTRSRYMEDFYNVYTPLFTRMLENNKDAWRRVYKSLVLLDYLLKNGSERFVTEAREKIFELRRLESYKYTDEKGKDQGINIRHRVKLILEMLNDDEKLHAERRKANTDDKSKYRGYDQYDIKMGAGGSYNKSSSYDNNSWDKERSSKGNGDFNNYKKDSREVSNFSFSSSNQGNRSPSPELGFTDDSAKKVNNDDDGFGDFVSSRSSQPAATSKSTPNNTVNSPASFFDAPPIIPPPSAQSNYAAPPLSPVAKQSNIDLLFDVAAPTPAVSSNVAPASGGQIDLFAQLSSPVANPAPIAKPTAAPASGGLDLFDFDAPVAQATAPIAPIAQLTQAAPVAASNGSFNGFDFNTSFGSSSAAPSFGNAAALQPGIPQQAQPQKQQDNGGPSPKVGNSFAGLDQFMSLSLGSTNSNAPKAKTLNQMMSGGH
uniref:ENTH domain-containing protein n=2 Tax=Caenorhabditis japonica TaxID=281687 RepID=A0A8R1DRC2_CAEJA